MKKLLLATLLLLLPFTLYPQNNNALRFRHLTGNDGLSSNAVRGILQTTDDLIWFGTDAGLNSYDGVSIRNYSHYASTVIPKTSINTLWLDKKECIWIGTDIGLILFDPANCRFEIFEKKTSEGDSITSIVYKIVEDKEGNVWVATYGQGVFKYNFTSKELNRFAIPQCHDNIYTIFVDCENGVWLSGNSHATAGVFRLNRTTNRFEEFKISLSDINAKPSNVLSMFEDASHQLWMGTWDSGLWKVDRYSGKAAIYLSPYFSRGTRHIHSINEYTPQQLLLGSDDGLCLFNTITGDLVRFLPEETDPYSLSNQFVYPTLIDREGGLWVGTYYGGVNYAPPMNSFFEGYSRTKYANSVSGNIISCFCEDRGGNIWIGSDDGGVSCFLPVTKTFVNYTSEIKGNSLSYNNVHALCFDEDDLWIGTYSGGLNVLNTRTGKFRHYDSTKNLSSIDQNSIYAIYRDTNKQMWVATMIGINLYDRTNDCFIRFKDIGSVTMDIKQDQRGALWFATQGKGLFKFDTTTSIWTNYLSSETSNTLQSNTVNTLCVDTKGRMWVGTAEGVALYKPDEDAFERIDLGFDHQSISCILEEDNHYWITTEKGLFHYVPGEKTQQYTQTDGLQSHLFLPSSGMKASNGKMYIGSVNGFNAFYPYRIRPNAFIPPVVLTGLEIYNREMLVSDEGVLPLSLNNLAELNLSYRHNVFSISYAALSYAMPGKNQYAYILEGFDQRWNYVGNQTKATYTNLSPGKYFFRVKASNNDGVWNNEGTVIAIVIHPPFYLTLPFKIFYVLLALIGVISLLLFFNRRTKKRHKEEIAELNRQKEHEMHEAKISFFTTIAHEIRTPVSLIMGPIETIMNSSFESLSIPLQNSIRVIDRNSRRLLDLVNQLLDFRKIEEGGGNLKFESTDIVELIQAICIRFTPWIELHGATFKVENPDKTFFAVVDKEALTKLISNLLTNAGKYTKDKVLLSYALNADGNTFLITVSDNGCGMSQEEQLRIFEPFYQTMDNKPGTGIGLSIVKNIVEVHRGEIAVDSQKGIGSRFTVTFPVRQSDMPIVDNECLDIPNDIIDTPLYVGSQSGKMTMLIVDDNEDMIHFLTDSFTDEYTIIPAENGEQALECLRSTSNVALVVSDWMMPVMSGVELCRVVRSDQSLSHIPFILLTARMDLKSKIEGIDCGADAYVEKPFSIQYLKSCIHNLIALRQMLLQKFSQMPLVPLKSVASNKADELFLSKMNELIEQNFSNSDLSVDFMAEQLNISRSGLFAKIKTLTEVTPNELIQLVRLKKAAELLQEGQYRISEICYMVGFNNPSYFAKCFQKQFGLKPGEFAKK